MARRSSRVSSPSSATGSSDAVYWSPMEVGNNNGGFNAGRYLVPCTAAAGHAGVCNNRSARGRIRWLAVVAVAGSLRHTTDLEGVAPCG